MADPIAIQVPLARADKYSTADNAKSAVTFSMDFSNAEIYTADLGQQQAGGTFGIPRTLFLDNSKNPSEIKITINTTNQQFPFPPYSVGYVPIEAVDQSVITFDSAGGATDLVTATIFSYILPSIIYSGFGPITPGVISGIYGEDGATIMSPTNPLATVEHQTTAATNRNTTLVAGVASNVILGGGAPVLAEFRNVGANIAYYKVGGVANGTFANGDKRLQVGEKVVMPIRTSLAISFYSALGTSIEAETYN